MKTIYFGKYHKDETLEKEKIEWLVLDEDEEALFVVSKQAVISRCFDPEGEEWEESEIRRWLNTKFYDEAFNSYEKGSILVTEVRTTDWVNKMFCDNCDYVDTQDRVFLLSAEEVKKYFPEQDSRIQEKSKYAQYTLEDDWKSANAWWLRNKGFYNSAGLLVEWDGGFDWYGGTQNIRGIRPAMRIQKKWCDYYVLDGQVDLFEVEKN